jgi:hypothetical protein
MLISLCLFAIAIRRPKRDRPKHLNKQAKPANAALSRKNQPLIDTDAGGPPGDSRRSNRKQKHRPAKDQPIGQDVSDPNAQLDESGNDNHGSQSHDRARQPPLIADEGADQADPEKAAKQRQLAQAREAKRKLKDREKDIDDAKQRLVARKERSTRHQSRVVASRLGLLKVVAIATVVMTTVMLFFLAFMGKRLGLCSESRRRHPVAFVPPVWTV